MFQRVKRAFFAVSVFGLALVLAACSNEESPAESVMMEGVEVVRSLPPTVEGESFVEPLNPTGPRRGGVLAAPMISCRPPDPAIDDASAWHDLSSPPLVTEIHAGLTRIVDNPVAPFEMELADSYNVSSDGLEYEFILRNDLKFSDGSPLTSSDFKWSWERALKKSDAGSRARDVFGLVAGAEAVILGESEDLTGVVVIDDRTLQVSLTNPRADFPALLADPVASVLKKDNVLSWGIEWRNSGSWTLTVPFSEWNMPVGAGPFKLVDYWSEVTGARCPIVRNPHYWGEPAYLDGVWFRADLTKWERNDDGGWFTLPLDPMAFVHEEVDFEQMSTVYKEKVSEDEVESDVTFGTDEGIEVDGAQDDVADFAPTFIFAVLNAAAPPFDDIHFRRAAAAHSLLTLFHGFAAKDARLITEELTTLEPSAEFIRYDSEFAESELAASKYSEHKDTWEVVVLQSFGVRNVYAEHPSFVEWAEALNLEVTEDDFGVSVLDDLEGRHNSKFHIRIYNVPPAYPDPVTILRSLTAPFGKINRAPEFVELDAMLVAAATERDAVKRHERYLEIEEYAADNSLVIPIAVMPETAFFRSHPWVHDLKPPKYPGSIFHKVWLDETAPKRELPLP